jgi:hypothetical protein
MSIQPEDGADPIQPEEYADPADFPDGEDA